MLYPIFLKILLNFSQNAKNDLGVYFSILALNFRQGKSSVVTNASSSGEVSNTANIANCRILERIPRVLIDMNADLVGNNLTPARYVAISYRVQNKNIPYTSKTTYIRVILLSSLGPDYNGSVIVSVRASFKFALNKNSLYSSYRLTSVQAANWLK